eukprot:752258-Hanusia_phi.AAC.2
MCRDGLDDLSRCYIEDVKLSLLGPHQQVLVPGGKAAADPVSYLAHRPETLPAAQVPNLRFPPRATGDRELVPADGDSANV